MLFLKCSKSVVISSRCEISCYLVVSWVVYEFIKKSDTSIRIGEENTLSTSISININGFLSTCTNYMIFFTNLPYLQNKSVTRKIFGVTEVNFFVLEYFFEYYKSILEVEYRVPKTAPNNRPQL